MNATTHEASLTARNEAVRHISIDTRATAELWLNANIKAVNMAEYQRYRDYLVLDADLVPDGVSAGKK
ncbi:hypothetical protein CDEF62S_06321 [Castellaniella defragrans]